MGTDATGTGGARSSSEAYRAARDAVLTLGGAGTAGTAGTDKEWSFPDVGPVFNWAHDWFDAIGRDNRRPALVISGEGGARRSLSFDDLVRRSNRIGRWLMRLGVGRGDPVVLMLGNQTELWETMLAIMKVGGVIVPTTAALGSSDLLDRIARSGARFAVCNPSDCEKFADAPPGIGRICIGDPGAAPGEWADVADADAEDDGVLAHPGTSVDDPLLYYFTSGTTSRPKLVEHTQVSYPVGHLSTMRWIGLRPGDVHCNVSSPGWAKHAWSCFFAPWAAEATVYVHDARRFDPVALLAGLREEAVTTLCAPPTVWRMLITTDLSGGPGALRELVSAGEPLNPEVIAQVERRWGLTIRDGYGQTETTASVANLPGAPVKPGSMGRPLPGVPVVLVDVATGRTVRGEGEGEICLDLAQFPLTLMRGYRDDAALAAEAAAGGYYHSGDVATRDGDGYLTFVGRTDDVFKSSDYKVSPFELESVLIEHWAVAEAAVVPAPDELRLTVPKAYVALAPGVAATRETALEILRFARERLAPFQRVRRIEFAELPKTISGKIRRVELRAREEHPPPDRHEWRDGDFPELTA